MRKLSAVFGKSPGRIGRYWKQIESYLDKEALADEAVREFEDVCAGLEQASICLDLGANKGKFTKILAETGAQVHAFEPDPWNFETLRKETETFGNVTLHNAAVAAKEGEITMYRPAGFEDDPARHGVAVSMKQKGDGAGGGTFTVQCVDFCKFVLSLDCDVDLVKIDIEGAEVDLLQALSRSEAADRIGHIFVETHFNMFPEQIGAVARLQQHYAGRQRPKVNFNWP